MADMQKEFKEFHEAIKLGTFVENADLRNKRDMLLDELKESLKDEKIPNTDRALTFRKIDQGSYAMNTGIKPKNDDYDIDVGVIFDLNTSEYEPKRLKKLVYDKLDAKANRKVDYKRPCITILYKNDGYHVDLVVYCDNDNDVNISWGKESSSDIDWNKSDPKGLVNWVSDVSNDEDISAQFRRCVRYLKKWKEKHFASSGNEAPPSIGLTIQARTAIHAGGSVDENDLDTILNIAKSIKDSFVDFYSVDLNAYYKSIKVLLPVESYENVYKKMSERQQNNFYYEIDGLIEVLQDAISQESKTEASKLLRKAFGNEFPEVEELKRSDTKPIITTGQNA